MRGSRVPLFALCFILLAQMICTVFDKNFFPFCTYNMFNSVPKAELWEFRVKVEGQSHHPGNLMPTEFFKAGMVLQRIFIDKKTPQEIRRDVLQKILLRARRKSWKAFDEIYPPIDGINASPLQIDLVKLAVGPDYKLSDLETIRLFQETGPSQ